jgi:hypothetical protein
MKALVLQNAPMTDNSKRTGAAIEAHYQFIAGTL